MTSDKAQLRRAQLLERVRSVEQRKAAGAAFRAEAVRLKLEQLSERTRSLAQVYTLRDSSEIADDLRSATILGSHLRELGQTAERQAEQARQEAEARLAELTAAERKRQKAEDSRRTLARSLSEQQARPESVPQRKVGTHLE